MKFEGRILIKDDKLYRVSGMNVDGVLNCFLINDMLKSNKKMYSLDPLVAIVKDTGINLLGIEEFSYLETSLLSIIDRYLDRKTVVRVVGYKSEYGRYMLVAYCSNSVIHMLDIGQSSVYGLILDNGKVYLPEDMFDRFNIKENVAKHYPGVDWTKYARFYKVSYEVSPVIMETLGRIFHGISCYSKVDLPLLIGGEGICFKIQNEDSIIVDTEDNILKGMSYREISLTMLSEYMETYYDYPCIHLSDEELEKVKGILETYGYGSIFNRLKEFNGIQSNFEIKENEEYVCIRDYGDDRTYSLHILRLNTVFSVNGIPLYYEIRMYPLCGSDSYIVVYSSRTRENCEAVLHLRYGNLIRGRLMKFKSYPYEITNVADTDTSISIRYTLRNSKKICEGVYNKKFMKWEYKSVFEEIDKDYLNVVLGVFDRIAGVKTYIPEKYSVYRIVGNRFCLERHFCIGTSSKFQGSRNIIYNANGTKFLIVKWRDNVNEGMWMFSKKDKSLIKIS